MAILQEFTAPAFRNAILAGLGAAEIGRLRPLLTRVRLVNGETLHEPGAPIEHVYFIEYGVASVVAEEAQGKSQTEVGLIGREGMIGLSILLDPNPVAFNRVMVQMPGVAFRMAVHAAREQADTMPALHHLLSRALEGAMAQVAQTAACNSRHSLTQRLSRWLLMAHDRIDGDDLPLTQEFLSIMLAVRRPGVTIAMAALHAAGLIRHSRGHIVIADRRGLEAAACACYARVTTFTEGLAHTPDPPPLDAARLTRLA